MIAYIRGSISYRSPTAIYLEAGNVAYHIQISLNTYQKIEKLKDVKLWIHLYMREDIQRLYGFYEEDERNLFVHLISVSGIGPNTALAILSAMNPNEVRTAITSEAVHVFSQVKGIGPKTAKRVILDLKDKIIKEGFESIGEIQSAQNNNATEAQAALLSLGFQRGQINKALAQLKGKGLSVEDLIKGAIQHLSK